MTHVSFETALKLREVGFAQPQPKVWQKWYCEVTEDRHWFRLETGELFTISGVFPDAQINRFRLAIDAHSQFLLMVNCSEKSLTDFCVYAPTVEELLTWKPRIEAIDPLTLTVQPCNHGDFMAGYLPSGTRNSGILYQAENAAEAAAKAILFGSGKQLICKI